MTSERIWITWQFPLLKRRSPPKANKPARGRQALGPEATGGAPDKTVKQFYNENASLRTWMISTARSESNGRISGTHRSVRGIKAKNMPRTRTKPFLLLFQRVRQNRQMASGTTMLDCRDLMKKIIPLIGETLPNFLFHMEQELCHKVLLDDLATD